MSVRTQLPNTEEIELTGITQIGFLEEKTWPGKIRRQAGS